jgi:hypothetical protein
VAAPFRLSRDARWWGIPGFWSTTSSPDGLLCWDGQAWVAASAVERPECLETMDPGALDTNRRHRLTLWQAFGLGGRHVGALLFLALTVTGCAVEAITLAMSFVVGLVVLGVALPFLLVLVIFDSVLNLKTDEGALVKSSNGRRRFFVTVGSTRARCRRVNFERMQAGAWHRIYITRVSSSLVNYERIAGRPLDTHALPVRPN